jgi:hypothetical protein
MTGQKVAGFYQFWKDARMSPQQKNRKLQETCQKVFSTPEGKAVLNVLLTDLFLYEKASTDEEKYLAEYAKFFVRERLGVGDTVALTDQIAETAASRRSK